MQQTNKTAATEKNLRCGAYLSNTYELLSKVAGSAGLQSTGRLYAKQVSAWFSPDTPMSPT